MRAIILSAVVCLVPFGAGAQTDVEFAEDNENGMLVVAENGGTAADPGLYRFVRIDGDAGRALSHVDIGVGAGRGQVLVGQRPGSAEITHVFHYAVVPPGDYALVFYGSSGTNVVVNWRRWACLSNAAPIYRLGAGTIAVVSTPDRASYDMFRDSPIARRILLSRFPPGTTIEYMRSEEKAALDFAEVVATNTLLSAPYSIGSSIGTLAFHAPARARLEQCLPDAGLTVTLPP